MIKILKRCKVNSRSVKYRAAVLCTYRYTTFVKIWGIMKQDKAIRYKGRRRCRGSRRFLLRSA